MTRVYFISDLHLGHKNILAFSPDRGGPAVTNLEEHDEWILDSINSVVKPKDTLVVLGDLSFTREGVFHSRFIRCQRHLVLGNHDKFGVKTYMDAGWHILPGVYKKYRMWFSHAPIHPIELRGSMNVHGHVHSNTIPDRWYRNVCVEELQGIPISLDQLREESNGLK